jgi:hypothetical protein
VCYYLCSLILYAYLFSLSAIFALCLCDDLLHSCLRVIYSTEKYLVQSRGARARVQSPAKGGPRRRCGDGGTKQHFTTGVFILPALLFSYYLTALSFLNFANFWCELFLPTRIRERATVFTLWGGTQTVATWLMSGNTIGSSKCALTRSQMCRSSFSLIMLLISLLFLLLYVYALPETFGKSRKQRIQGCVTSSHKFFHITLSMKHSLLLNVVY